MGTFKFFQSLKILNLELNLVGDGFKTCFFLTFFQSFEISQSESDTRKTILACEKLDMRSKTGDSLPLGHLDLQLWPKDFFWGPSYTFSSFM